MTPKERVVVEVGELEDKIGKLYEFITKDDIYNILTDESKFLLHTQFETMRTYRNVLQRRLAIWQD